MVPATRGMRQGPGCASNGQADKLDSAMGVLTSLLSDLEQELRDHNAQVTDLDAAPAPGGHRKSRRSGGHTPGPRLTAPTVEAGWGHSQFAPVPMAVAGPAWADSANPRRSGGTKSGSGQDAAFGSSKLDAALSVLTSQLADLEDELRDHNIQAKENQRYSVPMNGAQFPTCPQPPHKPGGGPCQPRLQEDFTTVVEAELGDMRAQVQALRATLSMGQEAFANGAQPQSVPKPAAAQGGSLPQAQVVQQAFAAPVGVAPTAAALIQLPGADAHASQPLSSSTSVASFATMPMTGRRPSTEDAAAQLAAMGTAPQVPEVRGASVVVSGNGSAANFGVDAAQVVKQPQQQAWPVAMAASTIPVQSGARSAPAPLPQAAVQVATRWSVPTPQSLLSHSQLAIEREPSNASPSHGKRTPRHSLGCTVAVGPPGGADLFGQSVRAATPPARRPTAPAAPQTVHSSQTVPTNAQCALTVDGNLNTGHHGIRFVAVTRTPSTQPPNMQPSISQLTAAELQARRTPPPHAEPFLAAAPTASLPHSRSVTPMSRQRSHTPRPLISRQQGVPMFVFQPQPQQQTPQQGLQFLPQASPTLSSVRTTPGQAPRSVEEQMRMAVGGAGATATDRPSSRSREGVNAMANDSAASRGRLQLSRSASSGTAAIVKGNSVGAMTAGGAELANNLVSLSPNTVSVLRPSVTEPASNLMAPLRRPNTEPAASLNANAKPMWASFCAQGGEQQYRRPVSVPVGREASASPAPPIRSRTPSRVVSRPSTGGLPDDRLCAPLQVIPPAEGPCGASINASLPAAAAAQLQPPAQLPFRNFVAPPPPAPMHPALSGQMLLPDGRPGNHSVMGARTPTVPGPPQVQPQPHPATASAPSMRLFAGPVVRACDYRGDPSDPIDMMIAWCLATVDRDISARLQLRRLPCPVLGQGKYEIDDRKITVMWSGKRDSTELLVREDEVAERADMPFLAYLTQTANVVASLRGNRSGQPLISRIPLENRLTFRQARGPGQGATTADALQAEDLSMERVESMRLACEQAQARERAALAYEYKKWSGNYQQPAMTIQNGKWTTSHSVAS
eukprot:TRINITY_DN9957_c1_g1_i4.p1 TRINITY_DN9957_c1_g1~~TRINITY_DN9957_c1_g1_i4.p1  ORF type:complete len:1074 (-),score=184.34 TRINITY_DN9957_c1_g1_i4:133-3354(-)